MDETLDELIRMIDLEEYLTLIVKFKSGRKFLIAPCENIKSFSGGTNDEQITVVFAYPNSDVQIGYDFTNLDANEEVVD